MPARAASGVALQIYADTNDSGGWDAGDALLGSATTVRERRLQLRRPRAGRLYRRRHGGELRQRRQRSTVSGSSRAWPPIPTTMSTTTITASPRPAARSPARRSLSPIMRSRPPGTGNDINNTLDFGFVAQPAAGGERRQRQRRRGFGRERPDRPAALERHRSGERHADDHLGDQRRQRHRQRRRRSAHLHAQRQL